MTCVRAIPIGRWWRHRAICLEVRLTVRLPAAGFFLLLTAIALGGCGLLTSTAPGPMRLRPVTFSDLQGWTASDPRGALDAFALSCAVLTKKSDTDAMGGVGYAGTASDWRAPCAALSAKPQSAADARAFLEAQFTPVQVSAGAQEQGLFTGYYEPLLHASRVKHGAYQTPVYGLPDDLVSVDLGAFRPTLRGERIAGRVEGKHLVPYATRAEIDANGLPKSKILFYTDDPVTLFFLHVQGSGRAAFDDGTSERIAYAGTNGHIYTSIGRTLIKQGALKREDVSLQSERAWLLANPGAAQAVIESDESFVFFQEEPLGDAALGAVGAQGVALTPRASLAVDPRFHPLGAMFFVDTTMPNAQPFQNVLAAQDIGGAIRGPVRGDIFWGFGAEAEAIAGEMKQQGRLYVLLPKPVAARLGPQADFADKTP
jgi:membrane-bound lytic murein transglycosylase A